MLDTGREVFFRVRKFKFDVRDDRQRGEFLQST